jgi:suppressor for copper-sensitivity B
MMQDIVLAVIAQLGLALGVGLYVATSPCLFPLLPLFLIRNLKSEESRRKSLLVTGVLTSGIIVSLAIYMALSTVIGLWVLSNYTFFQGILGILIVFFGIVTMSFTLREKLGITKIKMRDPGTPTGLIGVFFVGFAYSLLAAPCSALPLLSLFIVISTEPNIFVVGLMFVMLCMGVAVPYLAIAVVTGEARNQVASTLANSAHKIEMVVGFLLVILGLWLSYPLFQYLWFTFGA